MLHPWVAIVAVATVAPLGLELQLAAVAVTWHLAFVLQPSG